MTAQAYVRNYTREVKYKIKDYEMKLSLCQIEHTQFKKQIL